MHLKYKNQQNKYINENDHIFGMVDAPIILIEYGSYASATNRETQSRIANIHEEFAPRLCYIFRNYPEPDNTLAYHAAIIIEQVHPEQFWQAHDEIMAYSDLIKEKELTEIAAKYDVDYQIGSDNFEQARLIVDEKIKNAHIKGVRATPAFFINNRRYKGLWDKPSLTNALQGSLGHRINVVAHDFAGWGPSTGLLLLLTTIMAIVLANSSLGLLFERFCALSFGFTLNDFIFSLSLREWVNDGLLTIFFLVVGLEIKREFIVGHLSDRLSAALPVAGAIGGMVVPVILYLSFIQSGAWVHGWGIPIATDTAFAIALIVMMGSIVPTQLRVFLTVAAIVDDIIAVVIVAVFYSENYNFVFMSNAVIVTGILLLMNRLRIYWLLPYILLGVVLWFCIHQSGLHATLSGIILALLIPIRKAPNLRGLMNQASSIILDKTRKDSQIKLQKSKQTKTVRKIVESNYNRLEAPALFSLSNIFSRLEAPADHLLRIITPWSNYLVLPLFAFVNAGVIISFGVINDHMLLITAIMLGLVIGKPVGIILATALAVRLKLAIKPEEYSWSQLIGASSLAGIGFTMSLFIASQALPVESDFSSAKIAIFSASILSAIIGCCILWCVREKQNS